MGSSEKKERRETERVEAVLEILRRQAPLTLKQEKFCNEACVGRFLKAKGDHVKKAAKHLRSVLSWRESFGVENLMADEFSSELSEGVAYVAGHDEDSRPVMIIRVKQDYLKTHSQKSYVRLLVFTVEVAISSMSRFKEQLVLLFDAGFFRSASVLLNVVMATMRMISDNYPGRLFKAFVIDSPSLFPILWKGARPFVEQWAAATLVSSLDYEQSMEHQTFSSNPRAASLRFQDPALPARPLSSTSSRFSFTVSHVDALKPWYLNTASVGIGRPAKPAAVASPSLSGVSPVSARSFSFASPCGRSHPSTPAKVPHPRTPRPSFLQSPAAALFRGGKGGGAFVGYLKLYRRPYSEMVYRAKIRPPLCGLVAIVAPEKLKHGQQQQQQRHASHCHHIQQRF